MSLLLHVISQNTPFCPKPRLLYALVSHALITYLRSTSYYKAIQSVPRV